MVKQLDRSIVKEKAKKLFCESFDNLGKIRNRERQENWSEYIVTSCSEWYFAKKKFFLFFSNKIITNNSEGEIDSRRKTEEAVTES